MPARSTVSLLALSLIAVTGSAASAAAQRPVDSNPDVVEIRHYQLTMGKIDNFVAATAALKKLADTDPSLNKQMNADKDDETISQKAADWDLHFPQAAVVVRAHGLSTREYIVITMALINDVMVVGMKKQGAIKDYPPNAITPENAAFVEQNYDALQQKLGPLMGGGQ